MGSSPGIGALLPLLGVFGELDELLPNLFGSISELVGIAGTSLTDSIGADAAA